MIKVYEIDPLKDVRWPQFLERHPKASLFHSIEWLDALQRTYGYRPSVLTTSSPEERLTSALVFCRVKSWLTGRRLVSVPFSDHCTPLSDGGEEFERLLSGLKQKRDQEKEKYLEIRSVDDAIVSAAGLTGPTFCLHRLDLRPSLNDLFQALHASCIRRKISRAEREGLTYEEGTSEGLLQKFYNLVVLTRQRQQVPPQPLSWFRNLLTCMGERVQIRLVSQTGRPAAGILTICYKSTMTYKYGCSDSELHRTGCMQLLMWKAIQDGKSRGLLELDMGRTDWSNEGLLTYKDRWGGLRSTVRYLRYPASNQEDSVENVSMRIAKRIVTLAPDSILTTAGRILYRHIA